MFSHICWVATINLLKLGSIVALGRTRYWSQIKGTSWMKKKEGRHASPPVASVETPFALRFPPLLDCNLLSDPRVIYMILKFNLSRYCIYSPYCSLYMWFEYPVHTYRGCGFVSQNRGVTSDIGAVSTAGRKPKLEMDDYQSQIDLSLFSSNSFTSILFSHSHVKKKIFLWSDPTISCKCFP
jgi:hypothetical protein